MRTLFIIFALAALCSGQDAIAQAAKDVNVVNTPSVKEVINSVTTPLVNFDWTKNPDCMSQPTTHYLECAIYVPAGKVLIIEKVTGYVASLSTPDRIEISYPGGTMFMRPIVDGLIMEAYGPVYLRDNNIFSSPSGVPADGFIGIANGIFAHHITLIGRLVDDAGP